MTINWMLIKMTGRMLVMTVICLVLMATVVVVPATVQH